MERTRAIEAGRGWLKHLLRTTTVSSSISLSYFGRDQRLDRIGYFDGVPPSGNLPPLTGRFVAEDHHAGVLHLIFPIDTEPGANHPNVLLLPRKKVPTRLGLEALSILLERCRRVVGRVHADGDNKDISPQTLTELFLNTGKMSGGHRAEAVAGGEHKTGKKHLSLEHVVVESDRLGFLSEQGNVWEVAR